MCLADWCPYAVGELTNSLTQTVVNNSGIAINIEISFNRCNFEVSGLYNDASIYARKIRVTFLTPEI